jgi:hypothetical protein
MTLTTWQDDISLPQMNEWLAELRDDGHAQPEGPGAAPPHAPGAAPPGAPVTSPHQPCAPAQASAPPQITAPAPPSARATSTQRAVIGDQLRRPIMWCEMASCISYHADPAALGEADARARAIRAGWRIDGLGRLTCPRCQQTTRFWASRPVLPWDPATAWVATRLASLRASRARDRAAQARHHEHAAHLRMPAGRHERVTLGRPFIPTS